MSRRPDGPRPAEPSPQSPPRHEGRAVGSRSFRRRREWLSRLGPALGIVLLVAAATGLTVCDMLFGCGCEPVWANGSAHCDIEVPGLPDCPVCAGTAVRRAGFGGVVGVAIVGAMIRVASRTRAGILVLVVVGTATYLTVTTLAGAVLAGIDGNARFGAVLRTLPPPQHPDAH